MNNSNRPRRPGLTPEQERQRAEWQQYATEEQERRRAAASAHRQAAAERARRAEAERKMRQAKARQVFWNRFLLYLLLLAMILAVGGTVFFLSLHRTDRVRTPGEITYAIGGEWNEKGKVIEKPLTQTLAYDEAVRGGVTYLSMTAVADLAGMTVTGTTEVQKFSVSSGEYVRFTAGSATAEVNGELCLLDGAAWLRKEKNGDTVWVPVSFIQSWMQGIGVETDSERGEVSVRLDEETPVGFVLKGGAPMEHIDEAGEFGDTPAVQFTADLSAYEEYMNPADRDAYLTLINVDHKLSEEYIPPDLVDVADTRRDGRATQQLREYAAKALEAFFIEMRACGVTDVSVTSAYRSYRYQVQLFEQRVAMYPSLSRAEAEARAATVVAIPGSSEHQSGLCIDMHNLAAADISFANTASFKWMSENAHKFGFILRFPEDKVEITGISYEPWHYRYVGRYHATRIYESGLCLEEYMALYGNS